MKKETFKKVALCIIAASIVIGVLMMIAGGIVIAIGGSGWIFAVGMMMSLCGVAQAGLVGCEAQGE